jgi:hypothetical protein
MQWDIRKPPVEETPGDAAGHAPGAAPDAERSDVQGDAPSDTPTDTPGNGWRDGPSEEHNPPSDL